MYLVVDLHNPKTQEDYTFFVDLRKCSIGSGIATLIDFIQENDNCIFVRKVYFSNDRLSNW